MSSQYSTRPSPCPLPCQVPFLVHPVGSFQLFAHMIPFRKRINISHRLRDVSENHRLQHALSFGKTCSLQSIHSRVFFFGKGKHLCETSIDNTFPSTTLTKLTLHGVSGRTILPWGGPGTFKMHASKYILYIYIYTYYVIHHCSILHLSNIPVLHCWRG